MRDRGGQLNSGAYCSVFLCAQCLVDVVLNWRCLVDVC